MANYRVFKILKQFDNISESVYWEGSSIKELSEKYPPSEIWGADDLGHHEIEDGWIKWHFRFEVQTGPGEWQIIEDPRIRLNTDLSEVELEIDRENRHFFPGDYMDEEDGFFDTYDDGYDDYDEEYDYEL